MHSFSDKTSTVAVASIDTKEINQYVDGWLKGKRDDSKRLPLHCNNKVLHYFKKYIEKMSLCFLVVGFTKLKVISQIMFRRKLG